MSEQAQGSLQRPLLRLHQGQWLPAPDNVAVECAIALEFNGIAHAVMLGSPGDLEDFAYGFALSEGIVDEASQIYGVETVPGTDGWVVQIEVAASCESRLRSHRRLLAGRTGCGLCGVDSLPHATRVPERVSPHAMGWPALQHALRTLQQGQSLQHATGATHAAAWCDAQGCIQLLREDVGRHNALDKLIGALLRPTAASGRAAPRFSPGTGAILITSRASYEMVYKTSRIGVGLLVALSGVTSQAIATAELAGLTLLGFAREGSANCYCGIAPRTTDHPTTTATPAHPL